MSGWDHGGKTRQQRGYGREHDRIRDEMMKTIVLCEACQRMTPPRVTIGTIADHIKPLAKGGTGERSNYQLLCKNCAAEKDAADRGQAPPRKRPRVGLSGWPDE